MRHHAVLFSPRTLDWYRPAARIVWNCAFNAAINVVHHIGDCLVEHAQRQFLRVREEAVKNLSGERNFRGTKVWSGNENHLPDSAQLFGSVIAQPVDKITLNYQPALAVSHQCNFSAVRRIVLRKKSTEFATDSSDAR